MKKYFKLIKHNFKILFVVFVLSIIVSSIGMDNAIINWTFLLLFFGTTIGSNFFDKFLVKDRFSEDLTEDNLILRKISFYIGVVFIYMYLYIVDKAINSTFYYVHVTSKLFFEVIVLADIVMKLYISLIVFGTYWGTHKKIIYYIFKLIYMDKELMVPSKLAKVILDKGIWRVEEREVLPQNLINLERISINTFQIKGGNRNIYYVDQKSEIPEIIEGIGEPAGYPILGVTNRDKFLSFFVLATVCILPAISVLDYIVKIDDGIYEIVEKSDEADYFGKILEVSGDAIVYNGKVEAFDKHTQSFEHGTISIRKKDKHSIELIKNVGDKMRVEYQIKEQQ